MREEMQEVGTEGAKEITLLPWSSSAQIWGFTPWDAIHEGWEKQLRLDWVIQVTDVLLQK